jgi:hypothetical protein
MEPAAPGPLTGPPSRPSAPFGRQLPPPATACRPTQGDRWQRRRHQLPGVGRPVRHPRHRQPGHPRRPPGHREPDRCRAAAVGAGRCPGAGVDPAGRRPGRGRGGQPAAAAAGRAGRRHGHLPERHPYPAVGTGADGRGGRGALQTAQRIGAAIGTALLVSVFYRVLTASGHAYATAVSNALLCACGLMLGALVLAIAELWQRRHHRRDQPRPDPRPQHRHLHLGGP